MKPSPPSNFRFSSPPKDAPHVLTVTSHIPSPQALTTINIVSVCIVYLLHFPEISFKRTPTIYNLLQMASSYNMIFPNVIYSISCDNLPFFFILLYYFIVWVYYLLFIHSPVGYHLDCFHFMLFMNDATLNIYGWCFLFFFFLQGHMFSILFSIYLGKESLGHMVTLCLTCWETVKLFFQNIWTILHFHHQWERALFSPHPCYTCYHLFDCCHPGEEEVVTCCSFDWYLLNG